MVSINRRTFIHSGLSAATASLLAGPAVGAAPDRVLRIALVQSRGSQGDQMAESFCRDVADRTNGRLRIDKYNGGSLGGEKEITEDLAAGVLDFAIASTVGFASPKMLPKLGVFDVPFLFRDLNHARAVFDGPIGDAALEKLRPFGIYGLAWGENGLRQITTSNKPIRSPQDLAGLKMRVPQSEVTLAAFKGFGADAVAMAFPDVFAALADGSLAGQENSANTVKTARLYKVQKYLCLTDHVYSAYMLMASARRFDTIAPGDQAIIRDAARKSRIVSRQITDSTRQSDISDLNQLGMTVIADVDRAAFIEANARTMTTYEAMFGPDAIRAIQNYGA